MTSICPSGGPSEVKPGFNDLVVLNGAAVEAALTLWGLGDLALILAPYIAGDLIQLSEFCTSDPPADPTLDATDLLNLLNANPNLLLPAIDKVRQWFQARYWYAVCRCVSATTPAPPTLSDPGGAISINPGVPSGPSTACWDREAFGQGDALVIPPSVAADVTHWNNVVGDSGAINGPDVLSGLGAPWPAYPLPAGITSWTLESTVTVTDQLAESFQIFLLFCDEAGTNRGGGATFGPNRAGVLQTHTGTIPAGATRWSLTTETGTSGSPSSWTCTLHLTATCGSPGLNASPCCPPDLGLETKLNQILALLESLYESVPTPLTSYAESTVHAGLSGSGSFTIGPETIAIKAEMTTIPSWVGRTTGDPAVYFDVGWITTSAAEGAYSSNRLEVTPALFVLGQLVDQVHFTLGLGVVVRITELVRGP